MMTPATIPHIAPLSNIVKQMNAWEAGATAALRTLEDHKQAGRNSTMVPTSASAKLYQIAARRKWAIEKTQKKAIYKREFCNYL
jgi:hypothetical protein